MPSQQTICQQCGALIASALMPEHVRLHVTREELFDRDAEFFDQQVARAIRNVGKDPLDTSFEKTPLHIGMHGVAPMEQLYAERGDAIAELLDAVCSGATLEIQGPTATNPTVRAWIAASPWGKRVAHANGDAIGPVLVELARQWTASLPR
jgi:hypothetical protein